MSRFAVIGLAVLVTLGPTAQGEPVPQGERSITLQEAIDIAFGANPVLSIRRAEVDEASARLTTARTHPFNPEVEIGGASRDSDGIKSTDNELAVSQEIQIAGQRGKRVAVAEAEARASQARFHREQRLLVGRVKLAFAEALRGRELLELERQDENLAKAFFSLNEKRLAAGAGTQLDVNFARAALGRAQRRVHLAAAQFDVSRTMLAEILALDLSSPPWPRGDLQTATPELPSLAVLLETAMKNREDLLALRHEQDAAAARIRLARANVAPNLNLRGFLEEEGGTDRIAGGSISFSIPIFDRGRGEIAESRASMERVGYELAVERLSVQQQVATAYASLMAAVAGTESLEESVLGPVEDNLALVQRAFEVGKIGVADLLLIRREIVESRREYIDSATEVARSLAFLEVAAGLGTLSEKLTEKEMGQ